MEEHRPPDNGHLIKFIASTVEVVRDKVILLESRVDSIDGRISSLEDRMATKEDLAQLEARMATKEDLAQLETRMATKEDLARLEVRFEAKLDSGLTAVRGDIERVALRLDPIDHALSGRMSGVEAELSRLRSVVYLLAKDRPELVRLLGTEPRLS